MAKEIRKSLITTSLLFWCLIPVVLVLYFQDTESTLDINIHDTYIVIAHFHIGIFISFLFGIIGYTYWLLEIFKRKRIKWIVFIHSLLTIGGALIITLTVSMFDNNYSYSNSTSVYFDDLLIANTILPVSIIILVCSQLFLVINCLIGILKKEV